jgi:hypothetical protein
LCQATKAEAAVATAHRVLVILEGVQLARHDPAKHRIDPVHSFRLREAGGEPVPTQELLARIAEGLAALAIDHGDPPLGVQGHDQGLHRVEVELVQAHLPAQGLLRLLACGDVHEGGDRPAGLAPLVQERGRVAQGETHTAVG